MANYVQTSTDPGTFVAQRGTTAGSAWVSPDPIAGERNPTSTTNNYLGARPESNRTIIATSGSSASPITLGGGAANDTRLIGLMVGSTLAGQIAIAGWKIKNSTGGSSAETFVIAAAGIGYYHAPGCLNDAGALTVTLGATADHGKVAADWYAV